MPHRTRPMTALLVFTGVNIALASTITPADNLHQQTLQQMHQILTTRQLAHALLAINDYLSCLRALSSLWLARPRE